MVRFARALPLVLALVVMSGAALPARAVILRWVGPNSCGEWHRNSPVGRGGQDGVSLTDTNVDNAITLNWVLAFLSGYASAPGSPDILNDVSSASVAGWLDNYCSANPLDTIQQAAFKLRNELLSRMPQPQTPKRKAR